MGHGVAVVAVRGVGAPRTVSRPPRGGTPLVPPRRLGRTAPSLRPALETGATRDAEDVACDEVEAPHGASVAVSTTDASHDGVLDARPPTQPLI